MVLLDAAAHEFARAALTRHATASEEMGMTGDWVSTPANMLAAATANTNADASTETGMLHDISTHTVRGSALHANQEHDCAALAKHTSCLFLPPLASAAATPATVGIHSTETMAAAASQHETPTTTKTD